MKIALLLSGGVDSSVSLALLREAGYDVTAFYLKIWLEDELQHLGSCPWEEDLSYARTVCEQLGVKLEVIPFQQEYWNRIVTFMIAEIRTGRTPNPDVLCNQQIKFGCFLDAVGKDYDKIASGHYAQLEQHGTELFLKSAPDTIKDQTYFLCQLSKNQLARALFPIGHLSKTQVRTLAHQFDLPNKNRPDSQGICFLGKFKFAEFVRHHLGTQKGELREWETNSAVGTHKGYWFYTIGQRQRIGLGGGPWYVVQKDIPNNIVYISKQYYSPEKKRDNFIVSNWNKLPAPLNSDLPLTVKIRHGAARSLCTVQPLDKTHYAVTLDSSDQGIAAGQFAVFYQGDYCLGGGIIETDTLPQKNQSYPKELHGTL